MINQKKALIQWVMILCGMTLILFPGCGKKTLPVPPEIKGEKITTPFGLSYVQDNNHIELSWDHRIDERSAFVKPEGFDIFMAILSFDSCEGCPFELRKIGSVPGSSMKFVTALEKGYKYYFRVQARGKDNLRSEFSETVMFEYR